MSTGAKVIIAVAAIGILITGALVWGMGLYTDEVCTYLKARPPIVEKLGAVTRCDHSMMGTMEIEQMDTFVFDLVGPKGSGRVYVNSTSDGPDASEVYHGILLVSGGEEILVEGERPPTK